MNGTESGLGARREKKSDQVGTAINSGPAKKIRSESDPGSLFVLNSQLELGRSRERGSRTKADSRDDLGRERGESDGG